MFCGQVSLCPLCVLAVCGQGAWGWLCTQGSKCQFKLPHFLPFCLCSSTSIFGVTVPCVCSVSLWCSAFLTLSFFPEGAPKFDRKSGSCLLFTECPSSWSFSFQHSRLGCWGVVDVFLPTSIYQVWRNEQSQLRYFWLTVSQHAMHCAMYLALLLTTEINRIHTMLRARQEAILCINLSLKRQTM